LLPGVVAIFGLIPAYHCYVSLVQYYVSFVCGGRLFSVLFSERSSCYVSSTSLWCLFVYAFSRLAVLCRAGLDFCSPMSWASWCILGSSSLALVLEPCLVVACIPAPLFSLVFLLLSCRAVFVLPRLCMSDCCLC